MAGERGGGVITLRARAWRVSRSKNEAGIRRNG